MTKLHLVTGYMGEEHIQSADQGSFNAAFFGNGEFVMESGNQFDASIMDNNTVRILDGDALMKGRHLRIEPNTYVDVTIATGSAGMNRNDLIVFQYDKNAATGIESAEIMVLKGKESSGNAIDPIRYDGDILGGAIHHQMPMYRVKIEGVVLKSIEPLFTVIPTYKTQAEQYAKEFQTACETHLDSLNVLDTKEEVFANTQANQLAGALAVNEIATHFQNLIGMNIQQTATELAKKVTNDFTENRVLISNTDGKVAVSDITPTELNYLSDARYNIQAQIDNITGKEEGVAGGTSIHVIDAKDAPCLVNPYGNTTQSGTPTPDTPIAIESTVLSEIRTCRKNLLKTYETITVNGVTFTVNSDGSVTANGTATANAHITSALDLDAGEYIMSGCPSGGSTTTYFLYAIVPPDFATSHTSYGAEKKITLTEKTTMYFRPRIQAGYTANNLTFYPMVRLASDTDGTYEPYTETVATLPEPITLNGLDGVSDYVDMNRGVLVQKFKKFVANSSSVNSVSNNVVYIHATPTAKVNTKALCTHDENVNASATGYTLYFKDEVNATSTEAYKAFLDSNEVEFMYELAEPIITPLSEANIKALRELRSFEGITNVFNNANAEMGFIYATTESSAITMEVNKALSALGVFESYCTAISDWNEATKNGLYVGVTALNAPSDAWFFGRVTALNEKWIVQEIFDFTESVDASNPMCTKYSRRMYDGTWLDWVKEPKFAYANGTLNITL